MSDKQVGAHAGIDKMELVVEVMLCRYLRKREKRR